MSSWQIDLYIAQHGVNPLACLYLSVWALMGYAL